MLNPTGTDTTAAAEEGGVRARPPAPARPLEIDPAWRAGRKLTEARQQLGLSLEDVVRRTRVRREFLEALEAMNAKQLPGKAYAMAYLRSYARLLGLDDQAVVEQFQEECALSREDDRAQIRSPESRPHPERPWLFALALVLIAAGFVGWRALEDGRRDKPAAPAEALPQPARPGPAVRAGPQRQVEIRAIAPSWLEVRGPDGTVFLSRNMAAGDVYAPDASAGWTIHARDGGAFQVYVDGQPAGPLGAAGKPVLGRQIDSIDTPAGPDPAPLLAPPAQPSAAPSAPPPRTAAPVSAPFVAAAPAASAAPARPAPPKPAPEAGAPAGEAAADPIEAPPAPPPG
ncbi:MAG: helix-turn-helix domain-containing protein [Hyphomonadaceae bacterium]